MSAYNTPCGWEPCEKSEIVEIDDVLLDIARHAYEPDELILDPQNAFHMDREIFKFKKLTVNESAIIEFELDNDFNYYALVIDELEINKGIGKESLLFRWHEKSIGPLHQKLAGARGAHAPKVRGWGAHGLPGEKGGKGGVRHSPTLFLFIRTLTLISTKVSEVSFDFSLKGIPGGWGGTGGNGSDGQQGRRGRHGRVGSWRGCKRGKNGHRGGQPGRGGQGGDGGCGGNGPELQILIDEEDLWNILERSKYDVNGADPRLTMPDEPMPGYAGLPGKAGKPGPGGRGGSRGGNCRGGHTGPSGQPSSAADLMNWHLGYGLPGTAGIDGRYDFEELDDITRIVFEDPNP